MGSLLIRIQTPPTSTCSSSRRQHSPPPLTIKRMCAGITALTARKVTAVEVLYFGRKIIWPDLNDLTYDVGQLLCCLCRHGSKYQCSFTFRRWSSAQTSCIAFESSEQLHHQYFLVAFPYPGYRDTTYLPVNLHGCCCFLPHNRI